MLLYETRILITPHVFISLCFGLSVCSVCCE